MKLSLRLLTSVEDTVVFEQRVPVALHGDLIGLAERCRESMPELDFEKALILGLRSAAQAIRFNSPTRRRSRSRQRSSGVFKGRNGQRFGTYMVSVSVD
jgi:hypothetical protein